MDRQYLPALDSKMVGSGRPEIYLSFGSSRISHAGRCQRKKNWQIYGNIQKRTVAHFKRENRIIDYLHRRFRNPTAKNETVSGFWIVPIIFGQSAPGAALHVEILVMTPDSVAPLITKVFHIKSTQPGKFPQ